MHTKGEWKIGNYGKKYEVLSDKRIAVVDSLDDAHLIAAAPLGHELAEFVSRISAVWIDEGILEIGEGDYTRMKQLALEFLAEAGG